MARWHPLNRSLYIGYKMQLPACCSVRRGTGWPWPTAWRRATHFSMRMSSRSHLAFTRAGSCDADLRDKYLLRQAAQRVLPEAVAQRPKDMFRAPLAESFLARPPAFVRELISAESLCGAAISTSRACGVIANAWQEGEGRGFGDFREPGPGRGRGDAALASPLSGWRIVQPAAMGRSAKRASHALRRRRVIRLSDFREWLDRCGCSCGGP